MLCYHVQISNSAMLCFFQNLVHHCLGISEIRSLIINNNNISKDMVSTKVQLRTKSVLPLGTTTKHKDMDSWMENYEDEDYFEEKDFQE